MDDKERRRRGVLLRGGIQALTVTVELNYDAWSNYCVIAYDYLPAVFQLGMSNTPLLAYTRIM